VTLQKSLHDYVREAVDCSVHDNRLPTRPLMPAIVMHFVTAVTVQTHSNRRSLIPRRVQFDVYSNSSDEVDALATRLLLALDHKHGPMGDVSIGWATLLNDMAMAPEEQGAHKPGEVRYRRTLDFEVAYQERGVLTVSSVSS
jgi:hypothetical protein